MPAFHALHLVRPVLALGLALGLAGCDEQQQQPTAMMLMQAAANADGDGQQARAAFTQGALREQFQTYFGERFADEQKALVQQPQVARAEVPNF